MLKEQLPDAALPVQKDVKELRVRSSLGNDVAAAEGLFLHAERQRR
jgi:hypothetical protein